MVLKLKKKKIIIKHISKQIKKSISINIMDISNIKSCDITELRKLCRLHFINIFVVKNTLLSIIFKDKLFDNFRKFFVGSILIAFTLKHPGAFIKLVNLLKNKNNLNLKINSVYFNNKIFFTSNDINYLFNFPTYKEIIIKFIFLIKEISIVKFSKLLLILIKNKK